MQLLSQQCQLLHFAKLKKNLLEEFQDELLKILELCSDEKLVLIWIHIIQNIMWSSVTRSQHQVPRVKNYTKIDYEITLFVMVNIQSSLKLS